MNDALESKQRMREQVLQLVFDRAGGTLHGVYFSEIARKVKLNREELLEIVQYWKAERLMDYVTYEKIGLTHGGIVAVERQRMGKGPTLQDGEEGAVLNVGAINVDGAANFGAIAGNLNQEVFQVRNAGNVELAQHLEKFISAVAGDAALEPSLKQEIAELLEIVAEQSKMDPAKRKPSVLRAVFSRIPELIQTSNALSSLWARHGPAIAGFFNLGV